MENNIFEDAYFGKPYKTRDNTIVKFILKRGEDDFSIYIPKCKYSIETTHRYNTKGEFYLGDGEYGHATLDIISEWQEPIDEEELEELAEKEYPYGYTTSLYADEDYKLTNELREAFKAGHRKTK